MLRIALLVIGGIILLLSLSLTIWYQAHKLERETTDQPPSFDLFIAEKFFDERDQSPFDMEVPSEQQRPIDWHLIPSEFESLDTVVLTLTNKSGEIFYYESWGAPFTRHQEDLIIFRGSYPDSIPFGAHGCGTGAHFAPLGKNETMSRRIYNPLLLNPHTGANLPVKSDSFPLIYAETYGDSVAITFRQATYSTPWSKYKSQMISADPIVVTTERVIQNWRNSEYGRLSTAETNGQFNMIE